MSRIPLTKTRHIVERRIMWGDLDALGIVFYPRYYEWIDASGHLFFESIGLCLGQLWETRQILFGLVETACRYSRPGRYHQRIEIVTEIDALSGKTIKLRHAIQIAGGGELLLTGFETRICMNVKDPQNIRAIPIPDDIYAVLKTALGNPQTHPPGTLKD
jgi:YbgC/YbaW family acyl-CoA thioester hydrolase